MSSKSVQDFTAAVEHLGQQALVRLSTYFIQSEAAFAFISGVKDLEGVPHLPVGGRRSLSEACHEATAVKAESRLGVRLWEVRPAAPMRMLLPVSECPRTGRPHMLAMWKRLLPQKRLLTET